MPARRPLLIYDGECGLCSLCAEWARRRLPSGNNVIAWQRLPDLDALELTANDVTNAAYWIDADGQQHCGERAVARALVEIGGLWAVLGRAILLPPVTVLAAAMYRLIARNRHRLPGGSPACQVADSVMRDAAEDP
jgi:predicted DCC family thiol-disulfide oxidoreductase YuxK